MNALAPIGEKLRSGNVNLLREDAKDAEQAVKT
jgi:hypothetical protein